MSALRPEYCDGLTAELFGFVHDFCVLENGLSVVRKSRDVVLQDQIGSFPGFSLSKLKLVAVEDIDTFIVTKFKLDVAGEAIELDICPNDTDFIQVNVDGDPSGTYLLAESKKIVEAHRINGHTSCKEAYAYAPVILHTEALVQ